MRTLARCTSSPTARHEADETSPSIATTLSFSISFRAFCTATPGLASSSVISSTFRPRTPPFSFSSSTPSVAPCLPYSPMAPRKPVNGMSCPMRMGSCARTTAGNASSWVPVAAATVARPVRNLRRGRRVETSRCWAIWSPRERRVGRKWRTGGGLSSGFLGPILQGSVDSAERLEEAMGVTITLTAEDGQRLAGYRAAPPSAPRAGLVIVQEIFGVNSHIKKVCDGFAADGYVALAPAIFERVEPGFAIGYSPEDIERGRAVRMKIPLDDMVKDVRAAVKALAAEKLPVGVVGYCLGGTLAWLAATRVDGVACAVGYYGGGVADTATETPRCPVLFHFGETDQSIPPEHHTRIRAAQPNLPMHIYPAAGHGFSCDERGSYHKESAALARTRTLEFLAKNV